MENQSKVSTKSRGIALILLLFLGGFGVHRMYLGKVGSGLAMLLITILLGWLFGLGLIIVAIWLLCDFISICFGSFRDGEGLLVSNW